MVTSSCVSDNFVGEVEDMPGTAGGGPAEKWVGGRRCAPWSFPHDWWVTGQQVRKFPLGKSDQDSLAAAWTGAEHGLEKASQWWT